MSFYDNDFLFILQLILLVVIAFGLGWYGYQLHIENDARELTSSGMWIPQDNLNQKEAIQIARNSSVGEWICINIHGRTIDEMRTTVEHELAHELFAQKCETNITKCEELIK